MKHENQKFCQKYVGKIYMLHYMHESILVYILSVVKVEKQKKTLPFNCSKAAGNNTPQHFIRQVHPSLKS